MLKLLRRVVIFLYFAVTTCLGIETTIEYLISDKTGLSGVELEGGKTASGELSLRCYNPSFIFPLRTVYWRRNKTNVVSTTLFWWTEFYEPEDLKNKIKVFKSWRSHRIRILEDLDSNFASDWSCSKHRDKGFTSPKVFGKDASIHGATNGNLTLEVFPEAPVEGQEVTFSCSTDVEISEWEVMWTRNMEAVLLTGNSTCLGHQNFTTSDNMTMELEITRVSTIKGQHNITFIVDPSVLVSSTWFCQSDVALSASNNITILEIETTTQVSTTTDSGPQRKDLPLSSEDSYTYIIVGSVTAVVVLAAVIAAVVLIRKRKRKNGVDGFENDTSALTPMRKTSLVMEDNILYVTSDGEITFSTPVNTLDRSKPVMMENELYVSCEDDDNRRGELENSP